MSNPFPEAVRKQVWDLLRPYKDYKILNFPPITLGWAITRVFGGDHWG